MEAVRQCGVVAVWRMRGGSETTVRIEEIEKCLCSVYVLMCVYTYVCMCMRVPIFVCVSVHVYGGVYVWHRWKDFSGITV